MLQTNQDSNKNYFVGMLFACGFPYFLEVFSQISVKAPALAHLWSLPGLTELVSVVLTAAGSSSLAYVGLFVVTLTASGRSQYSILPQLSVEEQTEYNRLLSMVNILRLTAVVLFFVSTAIPIEERVLSAEWLPVAQSCSMLICGAKLLEAKLRFEDRLLG